MTSRLILRPSQVSDLLSLWVSAGSRPFSSSAVPNPQQLLFLHDLLSSESPAISCVPPIVRTLPQLLEVPLMSDSQNYFAANLGATERFFHYTNGELCRYTSAIYVRGSYNVSCLYLSDQSPTRTRGIRPSPRAFQKATFFKRSRCSFSPLAEQIKDNKSAKKMSKSNQPWQHMATMIKIQLA